MTVLNNSHAKELEDIFNELGTDKYGLSEQEATDRLEHYGLNELKKEKGRSTLSLFLHQFINPLNGILLLAAVISIFADHLADMIVIFSVILINSVIGFIQEYKAEAALEALRKMGAPQAEVIRKDGSGKSIVFEIDAKMIVPGDITILNTGDRVPADARLMETMNLHVDESMLTGESIPVSKNLTIYEPDTPVAERKNLVYGGTLVVHGRAKSVVVNTGMSTEMGKIATLLQETEKVESPIKHRISKLTKWLGILALFASGFVFIAGLLREIQLFEIFTFSLAAAVSSIPEGLPIVVTVTLAVATNKMARRNAIIRKIQAIDTLGTISAIISDKTGTLTSNQMTVKKIWTKNDSIDVTGTGFEPKGDFLKEGVKVEIENYPVIQEMFKVMTLCNDASLRDHRVDGTDQWKVVGDPTEGALIVLASKACVEHDCAELDYPRVDEISFDSAHKYMATFHQLPNSENVLTCVKGAPEVILSMCSKIAETDDLTDLSEEIRNNIAKVAQEMAGEAMRVLGFGYLETAEKSHDAIKSQFPTIKELVFLGLVGMIDPPRPEVKTAIKLCKNAGIDVVMATGDHKLTAVAIGEQLDIVKKGSEAITGADLNEMTEEHLKTRLQTTRIFARVTPEHKHRLVQSFQSDGYQVAVTGDGINDAPALKAAEVGIAMGIAGTDVTKETADVVLLDDNFSSIVNAIEEGRVVFENIRKVVKYLVATNMGEIATILLAFLIFPLFFGAISPSDYLMFTAIQILWVNLVTDGILDKSLAVEPKESDIMNVPPRDPKTSIIDFSMLRNILIVSLTMAIGVLTLYIFYYYNAMDKAKTVAFISLAMFQVFNALNCRSRTQSVFSLGFFTNKFLIIAIVASVTLQFLTTLVPGLQFILNTVPLNAIDWLLIVLVTSSVWISDEFRKWVQKRWQKIKS